MRVQPVDRVAAQLHELRPLLDRQRELEVLGTGVRDPHEHAPEEHVHAAVEQEEETCSEQEVHVRQGT